MSLGIKWGKVSPDIKANKIVLVCSGKSLRGFDFQRINNPNYYVLTVNDSVKNCMFADAWFTLDPWGLGIKDNQWPKAPFRGKMFAAVPHDYGRRDARNPAHQVTPHKDIIFLHRLMSHNYINESSETAYSLTLSEDPRCVSTGNSGYGAFNIAYHLRPKKILLLGLDGDVGYYYSDTERNRPLTHLPKMFNSTKKQIEAANIEVVNGNPTSKIVTYPQMHIDKALEWFDAD